MKRKNRILIVILIILIVFAGIATFTYNAHKDTTVLGENTNGTVYKITCGNASSNETAIMILGVHSLENGTHDAVNETLMKFTKDNTLNKKYIVYFIKLNFKDSGYDTSDYDTNRHMGELLANKYIVPDIENYTPYIVVDVHEMENYWDKLRYVGVIDENSTVNMEYADKISENLNYPIYDITSGTSPKWVTKPIYENGHNVILFETAQDDPQKNKTVTAEKLIRTIDSLPVYN